MLITRKLATQYATIAHDMLIQRNEPITVTSLQQQLMRNMREHNREYGDMTYTFPVAFLEAFIEKRGKQDGA